MIPITLETAAISMRPTPLAALRALGWPGRSVARLAGSAFSAAIGLGAAVASTGAASALPLLHAFRDSPARVLAGE